MDGFMEREMNPPPAPPNYDVTPPNSPPGTDAPHFASTKLRPKPGDGHIITVGCVPAGVMDAKPADPATKMAARARATAAVAARRAPRSARRRQPEDAGDASWRAWRMNKTLREPDVFATLKKKQRRWTRRERRRCGREREPPGGRENRRGRRVRDGARGDLGVFDGVRGGRARGVFGSTGFHGGAAHDRFESERARGYRHRRRARGRARRTSDADDPQPRSPRGFLPGGAPARAQEGGGGHRRGRAEPGGDRERRQVGARGGVEITERGDGRERGGGGARDAPCATPSPTSPGRRTRRHLLHHVVASREETSAWRYFHVRHTLFCTTLVETSPRVSARQSIFAFLSNSAARRDRFSAATLAAFLAAPALCVRLFLARYFSPKCAARPIPAATYTLVIHPDSRANSSASAALPPAPFFFDLVERDDPDAPAFALVAEAGGAPSKHHPPSAEARPAEMTSYPAASHISLPPPPDSAIQSESFAQMVSVARQGTMRCWASSLKYSSLHAR